MGAVGYRWSSCHPILAATTVKTDEQAEAGGALARKPISSERQSAAAKARWANPVERKKLLDALASPERRAKISPAVKAAWADPESRAKHVASITALPARHRCFCGQHNREIVIGRPIVEAGSGQYLV